MTIEKDIADAIDKNLPSVVGERLRAQLEELPQLRTQLKTKDNQLESQRREIQTQDARITTLELQIKRNGELDAREAAVAKRELKQDLLELQLKLADERRTEIKGLVDTIFRSPVYERRVHGSVPVPLEGSPGGNGSYPSPGFVGVGGVDVTTTEARR